jgi:pSer/pThr/pTyr-binding forkhead associated (FHA) protein
VSQGSRDDELDRTRPLRVPVLDPRRAEMRPRLVLETGVGPGEIGFDFGERVLGRAREADVPVPAPSLSRRHASLLRRGTDCILTDLDSSNGIVIDGARVHSVVLRDGDRVRLGDQLYVFRET